MNKRLYDDLINKTSKELTSLDYLYSLSDDDIKEIFVYKEYFNGKFKRNKLNKFFDICEIGILITAGFSLSIVYSPVWLLPFCVLFPAVKIISREILKPSHYFNLSYKEYKNLIKSDAVDKLNKITTSIELLTKTYDFQENLSSFNNNFDEYYNNSITDKHSYTIKVINPQKNTEKNYEINSYSSNKKTQCKIIPLYPEQENNNDLQ